MKKILNLLLIVSVLGLVYCCSDDDDDPKPEELVETVILDETEVDLEVNQTKQLTASIAPTGLEVTQQWKSSDEEVATVDSKGLVTAIKEGTATITATVGSKSASCVITVKEKEVEPVEYCIPESSYGVYAVIGDFSFGDFEHDASSFTLESSYTDMTEEVAVIKQGENDLSIEVDQGSTGEGDSYLVEVYIDWNGDGDFEDEDENVLRQQWEAKGKKTFEQKVTVPDGAVSKSRVRLMFYFDGDGSDISAGCGTMDSGDCRDITYEIK